MVFGVLVAFDTEAGKTVVIPICQSDSLIHYNIAWMQSWAVLKEWSKRECCKVLLDLRWSLLSLIEEVCGEN